MGRWIKLPPEELADYENGEFIPLEARVTADGVEVYDPHDWVFGTLTYTKICGRCRLMPFDYDAVTDPCEED